MSRPSKIDRLPGELRELIGRLRQSGRTIDEILAKLRELDVEIARSTLGRHIKEYDAIAAQIQQSRAMAEAVVAKFGDAPETRTARLNIELMHAQLMRLFAAGESEDGTVALDAKDAMFLSTAIQKLAQAAKDDTAVAIATRERVAKEAALKAKEAATGAGLSADTAQRIYDEVLGVRKTG